MPVFSSLSLRYEQLALGRCLRDQRRRSGFTLRQLATKCGLATARLSQIENGLRVPTLKQAALIAAALGVPLGSFFPTDRRIPYQVSRDAEIRAQPPRAAELVRSDGRREIHHNRFWPLADQFVGRQIEPLLGQIMPAPEREARFCRHHDLEFVSVLKGTIQFAIVTPQGCQRETLERGDCLLLRSSVPHCLRSLEPEPAETLHVLSASTAPIESAWDWFSPHAAAYLHDGANGTANSIGVELKLLRNARNWSLEEVSALVGVSPRRLEQFERDRRSLPLDKVMALARVFGTPIRRLVGDDVGTEPLYSIRRGPDVMQTAPRRRRVGPYPADVHALHTFYPLAEGMPSDRMFPYFIRVQNVADTDAPRHEHHGHEFFYVLDGELELTINVEENTVQHVLGPGDACYLDSSVPHLARGRTKNPYSAASAEIFDVFWCPLGESYLFED